MRKDLVDATPFLASYDQRQCDAQLKTLDQQIQSIRESVTPKSRFAFKRVKPPVNKESSPPIDGPSPLETTTITEPNVPSASHLDSCVVDLVPTLSSAPEAAATSDKSSFQITALHIRSLKNTILLAPVIPGSVLVHDCENCIIAVGCHQVASATS
ncbi:hypothetical protein BS47DRAFT_1341508 [Hydnum rufescens UP504]|uniref:C-CAP/cofactor C-like domain-containing protein n=1 Tax=Hydnum rufescens UP504 TaxID=1448309 RepID=A0A9P6B1G6_9AGAM|nr:hypothetical protein BS47DRAFT_1341508 [Hydnum rufescens UP504]